MAEIRCRAEVDRACYDGRDDSEIYPPDSSWEEDGTFNGSSVVCDACILLVDPFANRNDRPFLNAAIEHFRVNRAFVQRAEELDPLLHEAKTRMARVTPGSPAWNSAEACALMVKDEMERRAAT